jgi:hypothetical protein
MWASSSVGAADTEFFSIIAPIWVLYVKHFGTWSVAGDGLRRGSGESGQVPAGVKEVGSSPVLVGEGGARTRAVS